jgi:hypothetical protein
MSLLRRIDRTIESSKWLAAGLVLATSPLVLHAIWLWVLRFRQFPVYSVMFFAGVALVVVLCRTDIVTSHFVRNLVYWERKITQTIFSHLLMQPFTRVLVSSLYLRRKTSKLPEDDTGNTPSLTPLPSTDSRLGNGNWVMLSSPYCFPTASILLWLASGFLLPAFLRSFVIGFGVAYHIASVILQWKFGTSELRRLGRKFTILFLVPANLIVIGTGIAFALNGFTGLIQFGHDVLAPLASIYNTLFGSQEQTSSIP